jgi:Tol biopolymer transport system component
VPQWKPRLPSDHNTIYELPGDEVGSAFSLDGNQLAFSRQDGRDGNFDIFVKLVGAGEPLQLTRDSADDFSPAWSADGQRILVPESVGSYER